MAPIHHPWVFIFGLLGNIISFMVYLAPVPTFWRIFKRKSTEEFSSLPYVCALFSSMLWIYYALLKTNTLLLITINSFGCVIETLYIALFLTYAPKEAKMVAFKLLLLLNLFGFSAIILVCNYLAKAEIRVEMLGWICVAFAVVVFAAPLSVIRTVIRTKSVEFMPFPLSLCLTISAVMWFMYGLLKKDLYIVLPNVGGFTFGVAQMILYGFYRKYDKANKLKEIEMKLPEKMASETPVKADSAEDSCRAEVNMVLRVNDDELGEVVVVDVDEEKKGDANEVEVEVQPPEIHVQGLSPCGVDEIKMGGPMATTPMQVVDCVY